MEDAPRPTGLDDAQITALGNWGVMVPFPNVAGDLVLFGYPHPETFKGVMVGCNEQTMRAMEVVGREFVSTLIQHGLRDAINETREHLQNEEGQSLGVAFYSASLYTSLLARGAMDLAELMSITLPRIKPGVDTAIPLSPMHCYTLYWMADRVEKEVTSAVSDTKDLFVDQQTALYAARDVKAMTKVLYDKFQKPGSHPALHLVSFETSYNAARTYQESLTAEAANSRV